jgi:hypothetical protein
MQENKITLKITGEQEGKKGFLEALVNESLSFFSTPSNRIANALSKGLQYDTEEEDLGNGSIAIQFPHLLITVKMEIFECALRTLKRPAFGKALDIFGACISRNGKAIIKIKDYMRLRGISRPLAYRELKEFGILSTRCLIAYDGEAISKQEKAIYEKREINFWTGSFTIAEDFLLTNGEAILLFTPKYASLALAFSGMTHCKGLLAINDKKHPVAYWLGRYLLERLNIQRIEAYRKKENGVSDTLLVSIRDLLSVSSGGIPAEKAVKNRNFRGRIIKKLEEELTAISCIGGWHYTTTNGQTITQEEADKTPFKKWKELSICFTYNAAIMSQIIKKNDESQEISHNQ